MLINGSSHANAKNENIHCSKRDGISVTAVKRQLCNLFCNCCIEFSGRNIVKLKVQSNPRLDLTVFNVFSVIILVDFPVLFRNMWWLWSALLISNLAFPTLGALWNYLLSLTTLCVTNVGNIRQGNYNNYLDGTLP